MGFAQSTSRKDDVQRALAMVDREIARYEKDHGVVKKPELYGHGLVSGDEGGPMYLMAMDRLNEDPEYRRLIFLAIALETLYDPLPNSPLYPAARKMHFISYNDMIDKYLAARMRGEIPELSKEITMDAKKTLENVAEAVIRAREYVEVI